MYLNDTFHKSLSDGRDAPGLPPVAIWLALALAAATDAARLIRTLIFDVKPLDPLGAAVAVLFAIVSALACALPSLRASLIDPLLALRADSSLPIGSRMRGLR